MPQHEATLFAQISNYNSTVEFLLRSGDTAGYGVMMRKLEPGVFVEPTFTLPKAACQRLIDDLWDCGLRPSEGSGSAGALKATQEHLSDMRKLAFHAIGVEEADKDVR